MKYTISTRFCVFCIFLIGGLFFVGHELIRRAVRVRAVQPRRARLEPVEQQVTESIKAVGGSPSRCTPSSGDDASCKEYRQAVVLPINVAHNAALRTRLVVYIPEDFRAVYTLKEAKQIGMQEYFPKKDGDVTSWTEIITTTVYISKRISAQRMIECLKRAILGSDPKAALISEDSVEHKDYFEGSFMATYTDKGRKEVVYMKYYSGPYDCVGFQYAIALDKNMTLKKAKKKIDAFVQSNTAVRYFSE